MNNMEGRILVVDDLESNRTVVGGQLKKEGYTVLLALSGEEALQIVESDKPDLLILDVMMPGISGIKVAERLKGRAETASIPIIMLTALNDSDSRLEALSNGAEEFLTKPVARLGRLVRVRNQLKLKKIQDALSEYRSPPGGTCQGSDPRS